MPFAEAESSQSLVVGRNVVYGGRYLNCIKEIIKIHNHNMQFIYLFLYILLPKSIYTSSFFLLQSILEEGRIELRTSMLLNTSATSPCNIYIKLEMMVYGSGSANCLNL